MNAPPSPIRLTVVLTHPVQYYSPWFRHIAANAPEILLSVVYAASPTPAQQGKGFGTPFTWDVPLIEGYQARFAREAGSGDRFESDAFFGVDAPRIGRLIAGTAPDVVLIPGWHSIALVRALATARRLGVPALYRGDTHLGTAPPGWRGAAWRMKSRAILSQFDGWLAVGVRARDYLMDLGMDHRRVFNAPHAVDNDLFALSEDVRGRRRTEMRRRLNIDDKAFVVMFAGKFEEKKRPLDVVRGLARLERKATALFVGGGPLEAELRREATRFGVDARFAGFVNQSEMPAAYAAADCLVLPSDWTETWGLVVNEALAAGIPVVASDRVGCVPDLVDDRTGATFPFGDVAALAQALATIADAVPGRRYLAACRDRVAHYNYAAATAGLVNACQRATERHPRERPNARIVACCGHMVTVTGLERHTFETLRAVRERGALVHVIVNSWEHHRIAALADGIGATWSVGSYACPLRRRALTPRRVFGMLADIQRTSRALLRDVRRVDATALLMPEHLAVVRNLPALLWLRLRGVRVVMGLGNAPDVGRFYRWYWRRLQNAAVTDFVCNSKFTAAELLSHGVPASKVTWVYNVLPPQRRSAAPVLEDERIPGRIVFVGQVIPEKGLNLLVDALGLLVAGGRDVTLDVVGSIDGWTTPEYAEHRRQVRHRAAAPDLAGRVRFLGWREDVMNVIARASVHCAPSLPETREGFGYVNLEAKQVGVPSIVFRSGAFSELITHGVDGWICDDVSAEALAEGLERFLFDRDLLRGASNAARRSASAFDPIVYADHWWSMLAGVRRTHAPRHEGVVASRSGATETYVHEVQRP